MRTSLVVGKATTKPPKSSFLKGTFLGKDIPSYLYVTARPALLPPSERGTGGAAVPPWGFAPVCSLNYGHKPETKMVDANAGSAAVADGGPDARRIIAPTAAAKDEDGAR